MPMWDREAETMSRDGLRSLQLSRLRETLSQAAEGVSFYRDRLPDDAPGRCTIESFKDLPFTTKDDLQAAYPYGMFAVPLSDVVRIHSSSGTTGQPTVVGYTRGDLDCWSGLVARVLAAGGVTRNDVVQVAFGYGLFTGGLGLHGGAERIGATVVPVSSGNTARQILVMRDFGTTVLVCTPSYALHLSEAIEESAIDAGSLSLRLGLFGAEPWTEGMRKELEARLGISATDNYGLSEVMGPGVSMECEEKNGQHINEDHFLPEIIDPDTSEVLPIGARGELVLTTLTKEALPLIRYRTRDITQLTPEPCPCGRTGIRMMKPHGRTDDMLIIRGVNVFPSQIEAVLMEMAETEPHYRLIVSRERVLDQLEVEVEVKQAFYSLWRDQMRPLTEKIGRRLTEILGLGATVTIVEPGSLPRTEGKAQHVVDRRGH